MGEHENPAGDDDLEVDPETIEDLDVDQADDVKGGSPSVYGDRCTVQ